MTVEAEELKTFVEVSDALSRGSELVFVMDFKECRGTYSFTNVKVSVKPNALMLVSDKYIKASDQHFTLNNPGFSGNPVIDYGRYTIKADGSVEIDMTILSAKGYQELRKYLSTCELGKSFQVFDQKRIHKAPGIT